MWAVITYDAPPPAQPYKNPSRGWRERGRVLDEESGGGSGDYLVRLIFRARILAHTLATSEFGPEKPLPSNASGLFEDGITPACSKRQNAVTVPLSDVYKDEHGHLSSAIIEQVTRDIRAMEENGETHQEAVKKFSAGLLEKLDEMARGVDDMLHILASKCRCMTTAEKLELSERIHKLSEKAFDRVVEIIEMRRLANECSGKITFSLAAMDDVTLWRLYYCVQNALETNKT